MSEQKEKEIEEIIRKGQELINQILDFAFTKSKEIIKSE